MCVYTLSLSLPEFHSVVDVNHVQCLMWMSMTGRKVNVWVPLILAGANIGTFFVPSQSKWMAILVRSWICQKWFLLCLHQFSSKFNDPFNVFFCYLHWNTILVHAHAVSDRTLIRNEYINSNWLLSLSLSNIIFKIITVISLQSPGAMSVPMMPFSLSQW